MTEPEEKTPATVLADHLAAELGLELDDQEAQDAINALQAAGFSVIRSDAPLP